MAGGTLGGPPQPLPGSGSARSGFGGPRGRGGGVAGIQLRAEGSAGRGLQPPGLAGRAASTQLRSGSNHQGRGPHPVPHSQRLTGDATGGHAGAQHGAASMPGGPAADIPAAAAHEAPAAMEKGTGGAQEVVCYAPPGRTASPVHGAGPTPFGDPAALAAMVAGGRGGFVAIQETVITRTMQVVSGRGVGRRAWDLVGPLFCCQLPAAVSSDLMTLVYKLGHPPCRPHALSVCTTKRPSLNRPPLHLDPQALIALGSIQSHPFFLLRLDPPDRAAPPFGA